MGLFVFLLEDLIMVKKPTYEELEQRIRKLEKESYEINNIQSIKRWLIRI